MIEYAYLGEKRRSVIMSEQEGWANLGRRILTGWEVTQQFVEAPDDLSYEVAYLTHLGSVWAVYVDGEGL